MAHRKVLTLIATAALAFALALPALAAEGVVSVGAGNVLRVRSAASTSASVLDTLPDGKTVEVVSDAGNGWYQIRTGEIVGYASAEYITVETPRVYVRITATSLNVRSGAGTGYSRVATLSQGDVVEVLGTEGEWYRIDGGYISAQYTEAAEAPADTAEPEPEPEPDEPEEIYLQITATSLNVRSGAGTSYSRVATLSQGQVVRALALVDGWYQIESGYISADYVKQVEKPAAGSSTTSTTTGEAMAQLALSFVGYRYVYGGASPKLGFDCSGLVQYVCKQFGYTINRTASAQLDNGVAVSRDELQPGDLVFFKKPTSTTTKPVSHVGMYIGDGKFVHASDYDTGVKVSKLTDSYYTVGWVAARRIAT